MAKKGHGAYQRIYCSDRKSWREWLSQYFDQEPGVWLIYYKKHTAKPRVSYDDAVEEALCFGWIDSKPNKLDADRYMQLFTPRKVGSPWSGLNKTRVDKLEKLGIIMPPGQRIIELAKEDGSWNLLDDVEQLIIPPDLAERLAQFPSATKHFDLFSNSVKKGILWWIKSAKTHATREKRILQTAEMAEVNLRAQFDKIP